MILNIVSTSHQGYEGRYELNSIEQLLKLVDSRGEIIIRHADNFWGSEPYGEYTLEVYDDYRE